METYSPKPYLPKSPISEGAQKLSESAHKLTEGTQRVGSEIKSEAGGLADRAGEASKSIGSQASEAFDGFKSAAQDLIDDYPAMLARGKKQIEDAARRVSDYSDRNTGLVVGGALLVGVLLGHILTRDRD
jgi:ElaB/YqjD/DUF883 family membrane-anchored ribosome-binding protein